MFYRPLPVPAHTPAGFILDSPIARDVLDNGLRILTERMTQVRSISIGVWLTRGSRHETAERGGIAHFVEHMLFKGTGSRDPPRISLRRSIRSAASSTRSRPRNTRATTSRCSTSTCRWRSTSSPTSSATRRSAPTTSSARRRSSSKRSRWSRTRPTTSSTSCSRRASGRTIRSGRPILGTKETVESFNAELLRDYFKQRLHREEPHRVGGRQPRTRSRPRAGRGEVRLARRTRRAGARRSAAGGAEDSGPQQGARAEPRVPRRRQLPAEPRRPLCELRAEHAARRLDELAAVSERAREARPGVRGVQRPERVPRRRLVHHLRRLLERSGRRSDRPLRRRTARREERAGARVGAAAFEGSPEGQPDAEPREHGQPHVASRAPGDLLRSAVRPGRNAAGHRAGDDGRRAAGGGGSVPQRIAGGDGAGERERPADPGGAPQISIR